MWVWLITTFLLPMTCISETKTDQKISIAASFSAAKIEQWPNCLLRKRWDAFNCRRCSILKPLCLQQRSFFSMCQFLSPVVSWPARKEWSAWEARQRLASTFRSLITWKFLAAEKHPAIELFWSVLLTEIKIAGKRKGVAIRHAQIYDFKNLSRFAFFELSLRQNDLFYEILEKNSLPAPFS